MSRLNLGREKVGEERGWRGKRDQSGGETVDGGELARGGASTPIT